MNSFLDTVVVIGKNGGRLQPNPTAALYGKTHLHRWFGNFF